MSGTDAGKPRDLRLDVARGMALCFILFAHMAGTWFAELIPARFGVSDAADLFVYVSGYAVAIAFGGTFLRDGFGAGTARIAFRCLQLYGAQIGVFLAIALVAAVQLRAGSPGFVDLANLRLFFDDPAAALLGVATLTYVPWFLNILSMYIVVLALVPGAVLLARLHPLLVPAAAAALWLAAWLLRWNLPGDPLHEEGWSFNPFAWQVLFFLGFAVSRGWLRVRLREPVLMAACAAVLVLGFLVSDRGPAAWLAPVAALRDWMLAHADKPFLDPVRVIHFLAGAYLLVSLLHGRERLLEHWAFRPFLMLGRQALPTFIAGLVLAQVGLVAFELHGTGPAMQVLVNGAALALLFANAAVVRYFKNPPWKARRAPPAAAAAAQGALAHHRAASLTAGG